MKAIAASACAIVLSIGAPASAHNLDEYLQATIMSVETDQVQAQMRLTPGVAVFHKVMAAIDTDGDGVISEAEQKAYAEQVIRDLSISTDGSPVQLRLVSWKFAPIAEMKEGRGDIQLEFNVQVLRGSHNRRLVFENHHQSRIAVYLVNCLVPRDPNIQITAQKRNYLQSSYELDYTQAGIPLNRPPSTWRLSALVWLGPALLLLSAPLVWRWRLHSMAASGLAQPPAKSVSPDGGTV